MVQVARPHLPRGAGLMLGSSNFASLGDSCSMDLGNSAAAIRGRTVNSWLFNPAGNVKYQYSQPARGRTHSKCTFRAHKSRYKLTIRQDSKA